ncbi:unnamed protein product [Closterium sp. NIES-64]|nr:unnamed protein product [Closterium sp. NIES-64]
MAGAGSGPQVGEAVGGIGAEVGDGAARVGGAAGGDRAVAQHTFQKCLAGTPVRTIGAHVEANKATAPLAHVATKSPQACVATKLPQTRVATKSPQTRVATKSPQARVATKSPQARVATKSPQALVATKSPQARVATKPPQARVATKSPQARVVKSQVAHVESKSPAAQVAPVALMAPKWSTSPLPHVATKSPVACKNPGARPAEVAGNGPVGPVRCWPASSPGGRRTGGSCAVLASELPRGEEDRWVLCGAGQRAPQGGGGPVGPVRCWPASSPGGRRPGGSCAVLASELPRGEEDRWVLCAAGQRAPQGGGGPVGPVLCWPASSPGGRRTGGSPSGS